jgi:hypothetical protein
MPRETLRGRLLLVVWLRVEAVLPLDLQQVPMRDMCTVGDPILGIPCNVT